MLDYVFLLFTWAPAPLDFIIPAALCVVVVAALVRFIIWIIELIPFV